MRYALASFVINDEESCNTRQLNQRITLSSLRLATCT